MDFIVTFSYCVWLYFVVIGLLFVFLLFIKKKSLSYSVSDACSDIEDSRWTRPFLGA